MNKILKVFSIILYFLATSVLAYFLYNLVKINILPSKYLYLIFGGLGLLQIIYTIVIFKRNTKSSLLILFDLLAVLFIIVELVGSSKIRKANELINNNLIVRETKDSYYIMVNKNSEYNDLKSIENKTVYFYNDTDDLNKLKQNVNAKVNVILSEVEDYSSLLNDLENDKEKIVLISDANYDFYISSLEEIENDSESEKSKDDLIDEEKEKHFKILAEFELINIIEQNTSTEDIMQKPFIIYLSGIDSRSSKLPSRSRSDVNIFIVVNPKTRDILLVNTPRDYYVQLHGKSGLKDKLTHAGYVGGVQLSKATLEDLLGYKADYYIRVNFNSVIRLVDAIGGITVYSDVNYDIACWTNHSCIIHPGNNDVDGECALAFARERKSYRSGDRHRGQNQQQVIKRVIEKVTSSKTLVSNYDKILDSLNGTFETSLSSKNITSIIQFQLNDMRGWNITNANLTGNTGMEPTYTCPKCKRSVMYQSTKSINAAKAKIKEILEKE